jgi:hypothetical protein
MAETTEPSSLATTIAKMSDRERRLVALTATVALTFAVAGLSWMISGSISRREKGIAIRKDEIAQLESLRSDYEQATARQKAAEARIKTATSTSLFTLMQKAAQEVGLPLSDLNERRVPVKDSDLTEVNVDVTLKEISIDKLVTLLEKIEGKTSGGVVKVSKLKVKTRLDNPDMLEVSLTVSTWRGGTDGSKP